MKLFLLNFFIYLFKGVSGLKTKVGFAASNTALTLNGKSISRQQSSRASQAAKDFRIRQKLIKVGNIATPYVDQIMEATAPTVDEEDCGNLDQHTHYSDSGTGPEAYLWCQDAVNLVRERQKGDEKGVSYGSAIGDLWSKVMSKDNHVATELYDCDIGQSLHKLNENLEEYTAPVKVHNTCVGSQGKEDEDGRKFTKMDEHLRDQAPLSTFVKMDAAGEEWQVLDQLQNHPETLDKVATLDFRMHFCHQDVEQRINPDTGQWEMTPGAAPTVESDLPQSKFVEILTGLLDKFQVVGRSEVGDGKMKDGAQGGDLDKCVTPERMMTVSYVNKNLMEELRKRDDAEAQREAESEGGIDSNILEEAARF